MVLLYYTDLNLIRWSEIEHRINILPKIEQSKIYNLKFEKDRLMSLGGKLLLSLALSHYNETNSYDCLDIKYNDYGKPYIEGFPFSFNISHSSNIVICGFSDEGEIGVDIEEIRNVDIEEYHQVLNPSEYQMLKSGQTEDFFRLWTIKEAVMKAEGKGFYMDPISINIESLNDGNALTMEDKVWFIETLKIEGNMITIASSSNKKAIIQEISLF